MNYLQIEKEMTYTYNKIAKKYEEEAKQDWKDKKHVDLFLKYLKKNASILDIGCGTGELIKYYSDRGFVITGLDISEKMIKISKEKVPSASFIKTSLYDIHKIEEKFDAISATFVLVNIPKEKIDEVIKKVYEKLNKGGVFFIVFTIALKEGLQQEPLDNSCKYYAINYSNEEIIDILKNNGFKILESIKNSRVNETDIGIVIAKKK